MEVTTATKTPDTDGEIQPSKFLPFANGGVKKHHHLISILPPPAVVVTYRECLKNHAARLGGHALDGCGEFMPSPTATPTDPASLKCAACGCHRNFHRREPDDPSTHFLEFRQDRHHPLPQPLRRVSPSPSPLPSPSPPPPPPPQSLYYSSAPGMLPAQHATVPDQDQPTTNHHPVTTPPTPTVVKSENPIGRKRFRTKFSQDQKDKMFSFSEKLGWKMQKSDEGLVEEFCNEIGVAKAVLKVWMHNKKHTFCKKDINSTAANTSNGAGSFDNNGGRSSINNIINDNSHHHTMDNGLLHHHVSTNGSSSSS